MQFVYEITVNYIISSILLTDDAEQNGRLVDGEPVLFGCSHIPPAIVLPGPGTVQLHR